MGGDSARSRNANMAALIERYMPSNGFYGMPATRAALLKRCRASAKKRLVRPAFDASAGPVQAGTRSSDG